MSIAQEREQIDDFVKHVKKTKDSKAKKYISLLEKITFKKRYKDIWKRQDFKIIEKISLDTSEKGYPRELLLKNCKNSEVKVGYTCRIILKGNKRYIKLQLVNFAEEDKVSPVNKKFNQKCLFQCEIKVDNVIFEPLHKELSNIEDDSEEKELNFVYKEIKDYAIGRNCATDWQQNGENVDCIKTTFIPSQEVQDISNDYEGDKEILKLKAMSIWGFKKKAIIRNLESFVKDYADWISEQKSKNSSLTGKEIIKRQEENCQRIQENIKHLEDEDVFKAFQLANTAMYIQMSISKNQEQELVDIEENQQFHKLSFLKKAQIVLVIVLFS